MTFSTLGLIGLILFFVGFGELANDTLAGVAQWLFLFYVPGFAIAVAMGVRPKFRLTKREVRLCAMRFFVLALVLLYFSIPEMPGYANMAAHLWVRPLAFTCSVFTILLLVAENDAG